MPISKVGVCGCGLMGSGIAEVCAKSGYKTIVREVDEPTLTRGKSRIEGSLSKAVERGKATEEQKKQALTNLSFTTKLDDLRDCDIVVEAVIEQMEEKKKLWKALDGILKPEAICASNTSSLSITEMASVTKRPGKFIGVHFFNPVPVMKLVEIVRSIVTSTETFETAKKFASDLGKTVIVAKDTPGFIVNLLLIPYLLDAVRAVEAGVGTKEDIDAGMTLGCGHPMGPLALLDFVGLDTTYYIAEAMFAEFKDTRYAAPPLLKQMVLAGYNGRKAGKGFYNYDK